jgi:hypothetical protein
MVLVLAGLPTFLFPMRDETVSWIWYDQCQVIQVEATFAEPAAQTWPVRAGRFRSREKVPMY